MMESTKNRRIGNDISMQWKVSRNGQPEQLIGMDAHIYLLDPWGKKAPITYSIDGNTVSIEFAGKDQRALGWYTLVLVENEGKDDMYTLDRDHILKLVPKTSEEYGSGLVDIMSDIVYPVAGGGGGTTNYGALLNKPRINGHELNGDQSAEQLGLQPAGNYLTEHQPLTEYAKKIEIPDTSGFATTKAVNAKNLEQDTTLTQHSEKLTELEQRLDEGGGGGGTPGAPGKDGLSAYELAVKDGFVGTEQEWLASLKGDPGRPGLDGAKGPKGEQGNTGSSVDYPFELVNNLTEGGVDKALTAEQGKILANDLDCLKKGEGDPIEPEGWKSGFINNRGVIGVDSTYVYSSPIFIPANNRVTIYVGAYKDVAVLSTSDITGQDLRPILLSKESVGALVVRYSYTTRNDTYIVICGRVEYERTILVKGIGTDEDKNALPYSIQHNKVIISSPFGDLSSSNANTTLIFENHNLDEFIKIKAFGYSAKVNGYILYASAEINKDSCLHKKFYEDFQRDKEGCITINARGAEFIAVNINASIKSSEDLNNILAVGIPYTGLFIKESSSLKAQKGTAFSASGAKVDAPSYSLVEMQKVDSNRPLLLKDIRQYSQLQIGFWKGQKWLGYFDVSYRGEDTYTAIPLLDTADTFAINISSNDNQEVKVSIYTDTIVKETPSSEDYKVYRNTVPTIGKDNFGELVKLSNFDTVVVNCDGCSSVEVRGLPTDGVDKMTLMGYLCYNGPVKKETAIEGVSKIGYNTNNLYALAISQGAKNVVLYIPKGMNIKLDYGKMGVQKNPIVPHNTVVEYSGLYIFPFRMLKGYPVYLYKDAIYSNLNGKLLVSNDLVRRQETVDNYTSKVFKVNPSADTNIVLSGYDGFDALKVSKKVKVTVRQSTPAEKLSTKTEFNILFTGDSLLQFNQNLIGAEFVRMLNTEDNVQHERDGAIQVPTLNLCKGKIRTVGEEIGIDGIHYQTIASCKDAMTSKRSAGIPVWGDNPFYNYESAEPDTLDEKGWNRRVDFQWYFNRVMGAAKCPDLVYLTMGPNDLARDWWAYESVDTIAENVAEFCTRIKNACDAICGGNSSTVIKILTHQTYPIDAMHRYNYPIQRQRILYCLLYQAYCDKIKEKGMDSFVEIIDCGSRFDQEVGYSRKAVQYNKRCSVTDDTYIEEACHMNRIGAYMYADTLITDFIADERFD